MALNRKDVKPKKLDEEELLVFGYSCKLFRDDEKAKIIDEGQHLIPWMGQENLRIDRYDARGTLYDLSHTEAPPGGYDRFIELTEGEKTVELACDEERYRALHTNEEEDRLYREEEEKRHEASDGKTYGQVAYQYDENKDVVETVKEDIEVEDDRPFVAPPMLDIPVNMPLPATMKHNAIIEKTAMFISSQGAQMEIILKAKQAGNPMFDFLTFGNCLHGYYRLVLGYIKSGRYIPPTLLDPPAQEPQSASEESYLHPSLFAAAPIIHSTTPVNEDSATASIYSELLTKLKKKANELKQLNEEKVGTEKCKIPGKKLEVNCLEPPKMESADIPPIECVVIISKMASYAVKNGRGFEDVIKKKRDPKLQFLESSHVYHDYYLHKIAHYEKIGQENGKNEPEKIRKSEQKKKEKKSEHKKEDVPKVAPICFAIKPKEPPCMREKSALPLEENSDEDENEQNQEAVKSETNKDLKPPQVIDLDPGDLSEDETKIPTVRDKQLQLERKRKVSAFLKSLNVQENVASPPRSNESSPKKLKNRKRSESLDEDIFPRM